MIKNIIKQMTFEEKAMMLSYYYRFDTAEVERLGVPKITMGDGPNGVRPYKPDPEQLLAGGCTAYPTASALSSTWNKELAYKTGASVARDCIANKVDVIFGPGVNLKRTPLCGRNFEYFSEDPVLSGEIGAGWIKGSEDRGIGTCVKHFALNNQETTKTRLTVEVDERTLRELYLRSFEIAVKKGNPASIMAAYNRVLGSYCTENKKLIDILRDEWGYKGAIISDYAAVKNVAESFAAGLNLQMPKNPNMEADLRKGIEEGILTEERIDEVLEELLTFIFAMHNAQKSNEEYDRQKQHRDAYDIASEAITLLKNEKNILPISKEKYKRIIIFGGWAEDPFIMGGGSSEVPAAKEMITNPLEEIKKLAGDDIEVIYSKAYSEPAKRGIRNTIYPIHKMLRECTKEDIVLYFISTDVAEAEGLDRYSVHFNYYIDDIISHTPVAAENIVVIMQTGSSYIPYLWDKRVNVIIQMWYAGEAGGEAMADILFGKVNPSGKLSETFPIKFRENFEHISLESSIDYKEGMEIGYRYYDKHPEEIWYPFGHGISYTEFEYSNSTINVDNENIEISVDIKNIGEVTGKEAVQIYFGKKDSIFKRPIKELKAFTKIEVLPGETKKASVVIPFSDLAIYDTSRSMWRVEEGEYQVYIAASSQDIRLTGSVRI